VKLAAKVRERFGAAVYESLTGRSAKQASDNAKKDRTAGHR